MPTQTFWNLSEEKRNKLIKAAKKEFARVVLSEASINKIIQDAGIPRGSFYMYFKDKEDLYFSILFEYRDLFLVHLEKRLKQYKGDLLLTFEVLYEDLISFCMQEEYVSYFRNVFLNMNFPIEKKVFFQDAKNIVSLQRDRLLTFVETKKLTKEAVLHLEDVFEILLQIMINNTIPVLLFSLSIAKAKQHYLAQLHILKNGLMK